MLLTMRIYHRRTLCSKVMRWQTHMKKSSTNRRLKPPLTEDRCARPAPHTTLLATWTQKQMKLRMDKKSKWDYSRPLKPTCWQILMLKCAFSEAGLDVCSRVPEAAK